MRNSVLPVMGVLTVVAAAVGLSIGESAIAQIDPTYFQGALLPAEDVTKKPRPAAQPGFAQASGWAQGYAARAEDCGDCPALLTRQTHAPVYSSAGFADATIQPRWEQAAGAAAAATDEVLIRPAEERSISRYLHYPISADQAEIARARAAAAQAATSPAEAEGPTGL
jgi:multidrug resistance efflux pump